jgi:flagellar biosynthesis/type III secretory pathway protein FliH
VIRRLQRDVLLESIAPRAVRGGQVPDAAQPDFVEAPTDELDAQAYRQGYAEGFQAGEQDGRREAEAYQQAWEEETQKHLQEALQSAVRERERLAALAAGLDEQLRMHAAAMEQLAFDMALRGLSHAFGSMREDGESIRRLCRQMAAEYRGRAMRLEVAPADRDALPDSIDGLEVVLEHALPAGTCRIVTGRGYAESSLEAREQAVLEAIREAGAMDPS